MPHHRTLQWLMLLCLAIASAVHAENWPQFRGPGGQGESSEKNLPLSWTDHENVVWKSDIPGMGWSSPVVWNDRIFLTETSEDGTSCHVVCIERAAGKMLWDTPVFTQKPTRREAKNSFATPTPVTDGKMVYAVFKEGGIAALDFDGKIAWTNLDHPFYNQHGIGASPALYHDLLIVPYDISATSGDPLIGWQKPWDKSYVVALDKSNGKERWKSPRGQSCIGHTMPRIVEVDGKAQIISAAGYIIEGFDPENGQRIWWGVNPGESVVPTPVVGDGMVFTTPGWGQPAIRAWKLGGAGDITRSGIVWEEKKAVPMIPSFLFHEHRLYTLKEDGILQCCEAGTGKSLWKQRLDGMYSASPVLADGRIYFLAEDGTTTVIDAGPEFKVLGTNPLGDACQASMAVSDGQFFIRTKKSLLCIGRKK